MLGLQFRRAFAPILRAFTPGMTYCQHCGTPWAYAQPHDVPYRSGRKVFFLCERCWPLVTAEEIQTYGCRVIETWDEPDRTKALQAINAEAYTRAVT